MQKDIMNKDVMKQLKDNKQMVATILFAIVAVVMIVLSICILKESVVPVCVLVMIEAALALMMHEVEIWIHGVLILAQIVVGILTSNVILIIFCTIIYIAAIFTLKILEVGE